MTTCPFSLRIVSSAFSSLNHLVPPEYYLTFLPKKIPLKVVPGVGLEPVTFYNFLVRMAQPKENDLKFLLMVLSCTLLKAYKHSAE